MIHKIIFLLFILGVKGSLYAQVTASAGVDKTVCVGESVTLGNSPTATGGSGDYTYSWSPSTGLNDPNSSNPVHISEKNVIYNLTVTDNVSSETATSSIRINVTPLPDVNAGTDKTVCLYGDIVNISVRGTVGGSSTTGVWSSTGDGNFPPGTEILSTSYTLGEQDKKKESIYLILTSSNNGECVGNSDSLTVHIYPKSKANAGFDSVFCNEQNIVHLKGKVTGGQSASGEWKTNGSGYFEPSADILETSYIPIKGELEDGGVSFYLTSTGALGCSGAKDTVTITVLPGPEVKLGNDTLVDSRSILLTGSVKNTNGQLWLTNGSGNFLPEDTLLSVTYYFGVDELVSENPVQIILSTVNNKDCPEVSDTLLISTLLKSIPNAFSPNNDGVNDEFMVGEAIEVYNRWGQLIFEGNNGWDGTYKGEKVSTGTYFYIIKNDHSGLSDALKKGTVTLVVKE